MRNPLKTLRVAILSTKAEELAAAKKFDDAFETLEKIGIIWGVALPSSDVTLELNLVAAIVGYHTGRHDFAAQSAYTAATQAISPKSKLNFPTKCYVVQLAGKILSAIGAASTSEQRTMFSKYMDPEIDLSTASTNLTERFQWG